VQYRFRKAGCACLDTIGSFSQLMIHAILKDVHDCCALAFWSEPGIRRLERFRGFSHPIDDFTSSGVWHNRLHFPIPAESAAY
jgi:hypothetical protein